jgi:hypothetical protein
MIGFMIPRNLAELLAPEDADLFLQKTWGSCFAHFPGPHGKFSGLMPWAILNSILSEHTLANPRLRLYRGGVELEGARFQSNDGLRLRELKQELSAGATMIIGAAEQLYRPLRNLIVNLEQVFRLPVQANLYAAFRKDAGFDLHWDPQDTLIVQVSGRKRWKVYGPTRQYPILETLPKPGRKTRPVWNDVLDEGHLVHIPRGFWHVATPVEEPSLHLTITVRPRIGYDLIHWLADELITQPQMRMNAPIFSAKSKQRTWVRAIRKIIVDACSGDVIDRYFAAIDASVIPRPHLELPSLPSLQPAKIGMDTPIRLAAPRPLHFRYSSKNVVNFKCCGQDWTTAPSAVPALRRLMDGKPHTLRELLNGEKPSTFVTTRLLIQAMALRAVVVPAD